MVKTRLLRQGYVVMAAGVIGGLLVSCGSPASDPASRLESHTTAMTPAKVSVTSRPEFETQGTKSVPEARGSGKGDHSGPSDRASVREPVKEEESEDTIEERTSRMPPEIPEAIVKDLGSPDATIRYRALDYWGTQPDQPPLTPVFEAMEDEDPVVRAKAAMIVERHMDLEREQEGE